MKFEFSLHLITIKLPSWIEETLCPNSYSKRTNYKKKNLKESTYSLASQVLMLKNPYFLAYLKICSEFLSDSNHIFLFPKTKHLLLCHYSGENLDRSLKKRLYYTSCSHGNCVVVLYSTHYFGGSYCLMYESDLVCL